MVSPLAAKRRASGYTQESLAERLGKDRTTIGRWDRGEVEMYSWNLGPLAEALAITTDELVELIEKTRQWREGVVGDEDDAPWLDYSRSLTDTVAAIATLGRYDLDRRNFFTSAFAAAAAVGPSRDWLLSVLTDGLGIHGRVSTDEVDTLRRMWKVFADLGAAHGGGHARTRHTEYVTGRILPLLTHNDPFTPAGAALFEASAEHLKLLGMMAYDDGQPHLSQGYLTQALRLAQEARAVDLGANVMCNLALLAHDAGQHREAIQLASVGRSAIEAKGSSKSCIANLCAMQARSAAAIGEQGAVTTAISAGEQALSDMSFDDEPVWDVQAVGYLGSEYALACAVVGDHDAVLEITDVSIPDAQTRGWNRPVVYGRTARALAYLGSHNLDRAAAEATAAVQVAAGMRSSRANLHVDDLRIRLTPHHESPAVKDFLDQADVLLT